jgi:hypothetical protein
MKTSKLAFLALFTAILILGLTLTTDSAQAGSHWNLSIGHGYGHFGYGHGSHGGYGHYGSYGHYGHTPLYGGHIDYVPVSHGCHYDIVPVYHGGWYY